MDMQEKTANPCMFPATHLLVRTVGCACKQILSSIAVSVHQVSRLLG